MTDLHENLERREAFADRPGSERSFGIVFAVVFALISFYPVLQRGVPRWWALALAIVFIGLAILWPVIYRVPNRLWFKLGLLLAAMVGPVAIAIIYMTAIVPTGLLLRLLGKDLLRLRADAGARSYWIERSPPGPDPRGMPNQF
jgi:hypothetical protein